MEIIINWFIKFINWYVELAERNFLAAVLVTISIVIFIGLLSHFVNKKEGEAIKKLRIKYKGNVYKVLEGASGEKYRYYLFDEKNKKFLSYLVPVKDERDTYTFKIEGEGVFLLKIHMVRKADKKGEYKLVPEFKIEKVEEVKEEDKEINL